MSSPSIIFLNRVYPPAEGATGQLLAQMAASLADTGWRVTVITARLSTEAKRGETMEGVRIERVAGLPFSRSSFWRRAFSYLALYPAMLFRLLRLPRADIIVTMTDPPLLLLLGAVAKCLKRCRLVHWAQDLYPEVAEELGAIRRAGVLARICRALSSWGMRRHDRVLAVGRCMKDRLLQRGFPESLVFPNWSPILSVHAIEHSRNPFVREHKIDGQFVVMYSGSFGLAHPFGPILDAARRLQHSRPDILFFFVGSGPRQRSMIDYAQRYHLQTSYFFPPQPLERVAEILSAAHLHLASMLDRLCGLVVPSKVYGILAAGRPCIFLGPKGSEVARLIEEHRCGEVLPSANGQALADCLVRWAGNPTALQHASSNALSAAKQFDLAHASEQMQGILQNLPVRSHRPQAVEAPDPACAHPLPYWGRGKG